MRGAPSPPPPPPDRPITPVFPPPDSDRPTTPPHPPTGVAGIPSGRGPRRIVSVAELRVESLIDSDAAEALRAELAELAEERSKDAEPTTVSTTPTADNHCARKTQQPQPSPAKLSAAERMALLSGRNAPPSGRGGGRGGRGSSGRGRGRGRGSASPPPGRPPRGGRGRGRGHGGASVARTPYDYVPQARVQSLDHAHESVRRLSHHSSSDQIEAVKERRRSSQTRQRRLSGSMPEGGVGNEENVAGSASRSEGRPLSSPRDSTPLERRPSVNDLVHVWESTNRQASASIGKFFSPINTSSYD